MAVDRRLYRPDKRSIVLGPSGLKSVTVIYILLSNIRYHQWANLLPGISFSCPKASYLGVAFQTLKKKQSEKLAFHEELNMPLTRREKI